MFRISGIPGSGGASCDSRGVGSFSYFPAADQAAAKEERLSDRVAERAATMEQAKKNLNKAKLQADAALDETKDAVTLVRYAKQRLLEAATDYKALLK